MLIELNKLFKLIWEMKKNAVIITNLENIFYSAEYLQNDQICKKKPLKYFSNAHSEIQNLMGSLAKHMLLAG